MRDGCAADDFERRLLMSYSEKDGQVILSMSGEDYQKLLIALGYYTDGISCRAGKDSAFIEMIELLNRLNSGNPNYTPYQVEEKKP
jgi:hypothetical protein